MITIAVDFDGTLALGNKSHITLSEPNYKLIQQLQHIKQQFSVHIKIVTARGAKNKLSTTEKEKTYLPLIESFCRAYNVPYDEISFNKEYADLYIDDMTIDQHSNFYGLLSDFTNNSLIFTDKTVIKKCHTSLLEKEWYNTAKHIVNTPEILFCNDETIITQRLYPTEPIGVKDVIDLILLFQANTIKNYDFSTYTNNLKLPVAATAKTIQIYQQIPQHDGTFFHGDLSTTNIIKQNRDTYLIDPNYKYIFGSYLTDAGKAVFSYVAYEKSWESAKRIIDQFGKECLMFAVCEGIRVCKYKPGYISIVNNLSDLL